MIISKLLSNYGWLLVKDNSISVAKKYYPTCCGLKQADIYCRENRESPGFIFEANYLSQGRNILSTFVFTIPREIQKNDFESKFRDFLSQIEFAIHESYAVRITRLINS